jgi:Right handed beta helix region/Protein of unknown function (DUF1565)
MPTALRRTAEICAAALILAATAAVGNAGIPTSGPGAGLPPPLPPSTGETFYVSTTGSDSNPGSLDQPWKTVQHALDTLRAGQSALVRAGTYAENLRMTRDGTASEPITLSSYPGERAVLRPAGGRLNSYPIAIESASYFRLHGFVIEDAIGQSSADVYFQSNTHHVELSGNEVRNSADQGIYSEGTTHHLQILANSIHDNGPSPLHRSHGIYLEGVDQLVANNVIYHNYHGNGIQVYPDANRVLIVQNTVVENGDAGISGGINIGADGSTTVNNTKIVNNVVAFNVSRGIRSYFPPGTIRGEGNQAYSNIGYANPDGDFSTWQGGGIDYSWGNIVADPLLVDRLGGDFHLRAGSPAIDAAFAFYSTLVDFDGHVRWRGPMPDIGAFEH